MLYFAYGANMNQLYLQTKLPHNSFKFIDYGYLPNYIFRYRCAGLSGNRGVGNIEPRKGSRAYGVVIDLRNDAVHKLNSIEGFKSLDNINNIYDKIFNINIISYFNPHQIYKCFIYKINPLKINATQNKYQQLAT